MAERGLYQGYALQLVDDKGRVAIPAALRGTLDDNLRVEGRDERKVIISTHEDEPCLIGYDAGYARELAEDLKARERDNLMPGGRRDYNIKRRGAGASEALPYDSSGRFILPPFPRDLVNIDGFAFFYGVLDYFEIWDPRTLIEAEGPPKAMKDAARFFLKQKGVTL